MENIVPVLVAALIPTVMGMIYYNPKVFGNAWMASLGKTEEELKEGFNMAVVTIVGLVLSFLLAFSVNAIVELIHQNVDEAGTILTSSDHNFGHGAFHGVFIALTVCIPVLITNGMYERKSWKNLLINTGYWVITIALMSGLMDAWN